MKFLNDKITVTVNTNANAISGMYKYRVMRTEDSETIFVGNFYHKQGESRYTFDITDIVRSDVQVLTLSKFDGIWTDYDTHINTYEVLVDINGTTTYGYSDNVCKAYTYPNYNAITAPDMFFDTEDETERISILQQGHYKSNLADNYWDVVPIFPCYADGADWANSNFPIWFTTQCGRDVDEITLFGQVNDSHMRYDLFDEYEYAGGRMNLNYSSRLKDICNQVQSNDIDSFEFWISPTDFVEPDEGEFFAYGNECLNKRYFLVWQDRLGSMMSKPFNDVTEYSETFDKEEVQDYTGTRKLNTVQVQPKWKISSGWIKEVLYPLYESIYVSPVLFLYDMKYNKCYNVIVKGDYVEKTFKNQKRLINITLELEESKNQNILY